MIIIKAKRNEKGTARVTRIPERIPTEAITTINTSTIAVAILPDKPEFCSSVKGMVLLI